MKIAIASSGLGHVARGVETWALDTAEALSGNDVDVTLFAAGDVGVKCNCVVIPCMRRFDEKALWLEKWTPGFMWRWGLKTNYGWEQLSFWLKIWPRLRKARFDILHVQDPMVAYWCRKFRKLGLVKTKEILAHGTEEPAEWLSQFEYIQHLAPAHYENLTGRLFDRTIKKNINVDHPYWTMMPNFVDKDLFCPGSVKRSDLRDELGLSPDTLVIGTAATVKRPHKRIDYLIREFADFINSSEEKDVVLLIAGAKVPQSDELVSLAEKLAPGNVKFCFDLPRGKMPDLYRILDLFVLASVFEMMPIAVLEALSSGLPVVCNNTLVLSWMIGDGGLCVDMAKDGGLAEFLAGTDKEWMESRGEAARIHAVKMFSKEVVIEQYVEYYKRILSADFAD